MNDEYNKSNRETRMSPKSHTKHWCDYCDRDLVHASEKCGTCGKRDTRKSIKKETDS